MPNVGSSWSPPNAGAPGTSPTTGGVDSTQGQPSALPTTGYSLIDRRISQSTNGESSFLNWIDVSSSSSLLGSAHPVHRSDVYNSYEKCSRSSSFSNETVPSSQSNSCSPLDRSSPSSSSISTQYSSVSPTSTSRRITPHTPSSSPPSHMSYPPSIKTTTSSAFPSSPPQSAFTPSTGLPSVPFNPATLGGLSTGLWELSASKRTYSGAAGVPQGNFRVPQGIAGILNGSQRLGNSGESDVSSEQAVPRNCSELMRCMAAKYNSKLELYNSAMNPFRFPYRGPMVPLQSDPTSGPSLNVNHFGYSFPRHSQDSSICSSKPAMSKYPHNREPFSPTGIDVPSPSVSDLNEKLVQAPQYLPSNAFPSSVRPLFNNSTPMSSAQVLLNMVKIVSTRNQNQQRIQHQVKILQQQQLQEQTEPHELLRLPQTDRNQFQRALDQLQKSPTQKRIASDSFATSSPLDLSSSLSISAAKKQRLESEHDDIDIEGDDKSESFQPATPTKSSPSSGFETHKDSVSGTTHGTLSSASNVAPATTTSGSTCCNALLGPPLSWSVDDVYYFVKSIDVCAEYAENFRDQRIDGCSLSLLTEEHLTSSSLRMKLGPALRLRAELQCSAARLGAGPQDSMSPRSPAHNRPPDAGCPQCYTSVNGKDCEACVDSNAIYNENKIISSLKVANGGDNTTGFSDVDAESVDEEDKCTINSDLPGTEEK